jgi:hypothetical protein
MSEVGLCSLEDASSLHTHDTWHAKHLGVKLLLRELFEGETAKYVD